MIKKLSLLMLLMAFFMPWAANAQTTVEIGDGTSTTYYIPYNSLYNYSFVEQIYSADEIGMAGTINSIAFNLSDSDASQTNDFVVYMKNVQRSSFSSDTEYETVTSADIVFSGSFTFNAGWSTLTLTTPFAYDGSSNLLIAFDENSSGYSSRHFYYTNTTDNTVIDHYSDSYNPDPYNLGSYSGYKAVRKTRANIKIEITPDANYCAKPTLNPAEYIEEEQASFSWIENGTATHWVLQYSTSSDFSNATSLDRSGIPAMVISDLSPATTYYAHVKANCGVEEESRWSNVVTFTTLCDAITSLPWNENFDGYEYTGSDSYTAPSTYPNDPLPNCWQFLNRSESTGSYPQAYICNSTSYAASGNCLFFRSSSSTPLYAVLPEFRDNITDMMLSFTYRNEGTSTSNGTLYVSYMTDPTDASTFNETAAVTCAQTTTKTPIEVLFSNAPAGSHFAFKYQGGSSNNYYLAIDDVTVKAPAIITANQIVNTVTDPATQMTWAEFAQHVSNGDHFTSTTFTLMEDITITSQANQAGADGNYFSGTFEGNGKTITVNMTATGKYCAPFYGVNNATINNLTVTGSITSEYQGVGGICGIASGNTTFTNCVSDVAITSTCTNTPNDTNGRSTCGGFVGYSGGGANPTFVGCAFTGSLTASRNGCGGFIGFHASRSGWSGNYNGRSTYTNCLFAPSSLNITASENAVFTCGYNGGQYVYITITNTYYNEEGTELNLKQGKQAYSVTALSPATVAMNGTPTSYSVSGIDAYNAGIVYNGNILAGSGDNLSLTLSGNPSGTYEADHGTLTADGDNFTLTMEAYNTMISILTCPAPTDVNVSNITAHEALVTWTGSDESYIVKYRTAAYMNTPVIQEGFNESTIPSNWTQYTGLFDETTGTATLSSGSRWYFGTNNGVFDNHARTNVYSTYQAWLVTPSLTVGNGYGLSFDVALTKYSGTLQPVDPTQQLDDKFIVLISTDNKATWTVLRKWDNAGSAYVYNNIACSATGENVTLDLSAYSGQTAYIAFYGESTVTGGDNNLHIDNVTLGTLIPAGEWQTITTEETTASLTSLTAETPYEVVVQSDCGEEGLSAESISVTFTTEVSCPAPTNLTVSDIDGHGATVSWDKIATQETGDITYNYTWVEHGGTPDWSLNDGMSAIDRWTNEVVPHAFAFGLEPETEYDFYVRRNCGEEGYSAEVMVPFTTTVACPVPTDVTVSDITGHEATVTWTGSSESYNVMYRTPAYMNGLNEEFNTNSIPSNWTKCTGMVDQVIAGTATLSTGSGAWTITSYGLGSYNAKLNIWGTSANSWLVTPEVTLVDGATLNFDLALTDYNNEDPIEDLTAQADDRFVVLIYADNAWTILREWNNSGSAYVYNTIATTGENVNINLSAYYGKTVKIAFYGESTASGGDNDLHIDNVAIGLPVAAGEWQTVTVEEASVTLTGLIPETLYEVVVQGNCGEEGLSAESISVTFTTEVSCPAPTNLTVSDIDGHGATVSWDKIATQTTGDITYQFTWVEHGGTPDWTNAVYAFDRWTNDVVPSGIVSGLEPETKYDFYVRRDCGEEGYSAEVMVSFTTTVTCPAPTDVTVSGITGHEATVTWTGTGEGYNVIIGIDNTPIIQNVDFANGIPSTWNNDASHPWTVVDGHLQSGNSGISGSTSSISVTLTFPADGIVEFDAECRGEGTSTYYDHCDFTIDETRQLYAGANISGWNHYTFDVAAGQHTFTWSYTKDGSVNPTGDYFAINNVVMKMQPNLVWEDPIYVDNTEYTFTGLTSETTYFVTIQGDCGDEGMSAMSDTISFITDVTCPAPQNLTTSDVTSNSAVLHWTGDAESYNVSYFKTFFFDSFEEDLSQWTIYKEGDEDSTEWGIENPNDNSADLNAHGGSYVAVAYSDIDIHADNWLVTPQIMMPTQATMKFWVSCSTYDDAQDEYEVLLSTTGNAVEDFTTVLKEKEAATSEWTEVVIDLSAYDGQQCYIAIRHDYTGGFYLMVDDFGIFGWSEEITTTDNSLLIEDLLPETEYLWQVQANCGDEDGLSQWANNSFITSNACPTPTNVTAPLDNLTAASAELSWTGSTEVESYTVKYRTTETTEGGIIENFEGGTMPDGWTQEGPGTWSVGTGDYSSSTGAHGGTFNAMITHSTSGNETYLISPTMDLSGLDEASMSFWYINREWVGDIDGLTVYYRVNNGNWNELWSTTSTHSTWTSQTIDLEGMAANYQIGFKMTDNYGYGVGLDDINIAAIPVPAGPWQTANTTETNIILTGLTADTEYEAIVTSDCSDDVWSDAITFTTLDESTKIFITEGDWNDGDNWVPVGVPTIDDDVILRAEATVFDVAEANTIAIDEAGALIIEDGGQLKTNANVEATMKKFIIGYGTDYVETNNGYYLMTLPTAAPVAAADAGLITEESDFDLYTWDRTATDEEWQNNHDGIDLQNSVGFLYANRDDMEMSFTATLRNSGEPVVVTPAYDDVEHGGWNLCANPFPCEAYISTDAEGMTFYRLVDNELMPIEGAIAPLEAFFVNVTAAGQTFTISREATRE